MSFESDLQFSQQESNNPRWLDFYQQAFGNNFRGMSGVITDLTLQRLGIDRVVFLHNPTSVKVDEKIRRQYYGNDIFIEYRHVYDDGTEKPGWIHKDIMCDYLAYGWVGRPNAYLFDFALLQRAWYANRKAWYENANWRKPTRPSLNNGYVTHGLCVPIEVVLTAMASSHVVQLKEPFTLGEATT